MDQEVQEQRIRKLEEAVATKMIKINLMIQKIISKIVTNTILRDKIKNMTKMMTKINMKMNRMTTINKILTSNHSLQRKGPNHKLWKSRILMMWDNNHSQGKL